MERTVDSIMKALEDSVREKRPIPPSQWLEGCQMLNVLLGDEHDRLFEQKRQLAESRVGYVDSGKSVAEAKLRVEATESFKIMQQQEAKCERVIELIRIAKLRSRLADEEYKG